jgi:RNA polymerase sigma-B factor
MGTKARVQQGAMPKENQIQTRDMTTPDLAVTRKRQEENTAALLLKYRQNRDPKARERLVTQYANLVESIARRFAGASEPVEDLAQEGYLGLLTAIDLYDPAKNVKFSTYATHFIIGQIKHCLRDRGKIIKEPAWLQELNQRMTRTIEALGQQLSRPPTNLEIARMMDMTEEAVTELLMTREVFKVSSIDGGTDSEEDNSNTVDIDRKQSSDPTTSFQLPLEDRIVLETAMLKLKELEQHVLNAFYFKDLNQTEIARQMGISCNYVSHILRNATKKLKNILNTDELRTSQLQLTNMRQRLEVQQAQIDQTPIVDDLTRLYNRRYYDNRLQEEISRASRTGTDMSIIFVRLDGLANLARLQGTLKRDEALTGTADILRRSVRRVDILTRYDEQTFALILPFTGATVEVVTRRMEQHLSDWLSEKGWQGLRPLVTFGIGSAVCPRDGRKAETLSLLACEEAQGEHETLPLLQAA